VVQSALLAGVHAAVRTIRIDADLLPAQLDFVHSADPCVAYVGGIGSGKTFAGALRLLSMPPGTACMVCAPTYSMLKDAALARVRAGLYAAVGNDAQVTEMT